MRAAPRRALDSESATRRGAAHAALCQLGGVRLPASPVLWREHLSADEDFRREQLPAQLQAALDCDASDLARSLRPLQGRALLKHDLAAEFGVLLSDPSETIRNLAAVFLRELDSSLATAELRRLEEWRTAEDPEPGTSQAEPDSR